MNKSDLPFAGNETGHLNRQIMPMRKCIEWWEFRWQACDPQLEKMLRVNKVFQIMFSHITQFGICRQGIFDQVFGCQRKKNLPSMCCIKNARYAIQCRVGSITTVWHPFRLTCVNPHADAEWKGQIPLLPMKLLLGSHGGGEGRLDGWKGGTKCITHN